MALRHAEMGSDMGWGAPLQSCSVWANRRRRLLAFINEKTRATEWSRERDASVIATGTAWMLGALEHRGRGCRHPSDRGLARLMVADAPVGTRRSPSVQPAPQGVSPSSSTSSSGLSTQPSPLPLPYVPVPLSQLLNPPPRSLPSQTPPPVASTPTSREHAVHLIHSLSLSPSSSSSPLSLFLSVCCRRSWNPLALRRTWSTNTFHWASGLAALRLLSRSRPHLGVDTRSARRPRCPQGSISPRRIPP